jgi:MFS transporter, SHS family, sialic acid transporter
VSQYNRICFRLQVPLPLHLTKSPNCVDLRIRRACLRFDATGHTIRIRLASVFLQRKCLAVNQPSSKEMNESRGTTFGQWMALIAALLGWMFDGFELGLLPLVARPALNELLAVPGQELTAGLVDLWEGIWVAGFLVGMSTGGVVFGWLGDRIGRVRAMTFSVFAYSVFSGLCAFSRTPQEFFLYRFVAALGMGGEWSLGVALVMEIWPNRSRALLSGLIGAAANVGFLLIALFNLVLNQFIHSADGWLLAAGLPEVWVNALVAHQGWRLLMVLGAAPAFLTLFIRLAVPESEKWLHEQEKGATSSWATRDLLGVVIGAAGALLIVYLWTPGTSTPVRVVGSLAGLVVAMLGYMYPVFQFLKRTRVATSDPGELRSTMNRLILGACLSGVALIGTWASIQRAPSWANDLAKKAAIEAKLNEAEVDAARTSARAQAQIFSGIGAILGTILGALIGNKIGRRPTYTLLCVGSLLTSLVFFQINTTFGPVFLVTVFLAGGLTASFYGWLPLYLPELFRTSIRATGQGFAFNFGRILAAVAALQTGNLIGLFKDIGGLPVACSVMSLVYIVGAAVIWLAPETQGKPLPE